LLEGGSLRDAIFANFSAKSIQNLTILIEVRTILRGEEFCKWLLRKKRKQDMQDHSFAAARWSGYFFELQRSR
jgi:hypothetical protein